MYDQSCVLRAWESHEGELRSWLIRRLDRDEALAEEILQDVFLKAIRGHFCEVERARAWLFTTARNAVIDHYRLRKTHVPVPDWLPDTNEEPRTVDAMTACLPRALSELSAPDADILRRCDLEGTSQVVYAAEHGLSIPGAKSRLQRARRRLRAHLTEACAVRLDDAGNVCSFAPRPPTGDV
jgi:RNA polymerase sigma-70 factor (ECF subfamily)